MATFGLNFPEARGVPGDLSGIDPLRLMRELPLEAGATACWRAGRPAGASRRTSRGAGAPRRTGTTG